MTDSTQGRPADANPSNSPEPELPTAADTPADSAVEGLAGGDSTAENDAAAARRRILIGSQRDPAAYRARRQRDWQPIETETAAEGLPDQRREQGPGEEGQGKSSHRRRHRGGQGHRDRTQPQARPGAPSAGQAAPAPPAPIAPAAPAPLEVQDEALRASVSGLAGADLANPDTLSMPRQPLPPPEPLPQIVVRPPSSDDDTPVIPGRRQKLSTAMEAELDRAMAGMSFDDLMSGNVGGGEEGVLEPDSRHRGRVVALRRDDVFIAFSGREQGCVPLRAFETPPQVGSEIEVVVQRFNAEDGLYDLGLPGMAVDLGNWDEVQEGMIVEAQVTGHNTGGLECEVSHIRGFIPVSQISLYRVEDLAQFVGQRFTCLITEANRSRKNLVLSHRAILEREKEEKKKSFFESLAPGQIHEGTVRKLMDFGAFVELGNGVDGLLHISQLSWGRVKHPSEVLQEGQTVRVRIDKIDRDGGRIGLSYREMLENPWTSAVDKYPANSTARGKVTRLMEFGAFVELEPGVEGLVHISEMSHKRVMRASEVVKEGEEIDVVVLSVNLEAKRMSLSIKALQGQAEPAQPETAEPETPAAKKKPSRASNLPLKGGLGRSGGEAFGLKW